MLTKLAILIGPAAVLWVWAHWAARARPGLLALPLGAGFVIPYWLGVSDGFVFVPAILLLFLLVATAIFDLRAVRSSVVTWLVVGLWLSCTAGLLLGHARRTDWLDVTLAWTGSYLVGLFLSRRVSAERVATFASRMGLLLATWAVLEFVLRFHPFVHLTQFGGPSSVWAPIQYRAGVARSEAAFGHSVALGDTLAITIPFILSRRCSGARRTISVGIVLLGIGATLSRASLLTALAAISMSLLRGHIPGLTTRGRRAATTLVVLSAVALLPVYASLLSGASSDFGESTSYRADYTSILHYLRLVGPAADRVEVAPGNFGYASALYPGGIVRSVDNTVLLVGLEFGVIAMAVAVLLVIWVAFKGLREGSAAWVAVASQTFAVLTVAMITQYTYAYWICLGYAVGAATISSTEAQDDRRNAYSSRLGVSREVAQAGHR